jgi:hypothetical protein
MANIEKITKATTTPRRARPAKMYPAPGSNQVETPNANAPATPLSAEPSLLNYRFPFRDGAFSSFVATVICFPCTSLAKLFPVDKHFPARR